jgi:thiol-disulfide isomerase/thioredoxin
VNALRNAALAALVVVAPVMPAAASSPASLAPALSASAWLNGKPTAASLHGKVVLVDVFTVDCINCQNVVPNLRKLDAQHDTGLAIVGIHSPETPAERKRAYVVSQLQTQGIVWPVAIDNDFAVWRAYGVTAWPTELIFDKHGKLRKTIVGDSQDDAVDATIRSLLAES